MNKILTTVALLIAFNSFGTTIEVYDKNDSRLKAYMDSLHCYECGLYQVEVAKKIKDPYNVAEGSVAMAKINLKCGKNNTKIERIGLREDLWFRYKEATRKSVSSRKLSNGMVENTYIYTLHNWVTDVYKEPEIVVVYKKVVRPTARLMPIKKITLQFAEAQLIIPTSRHEKILLPGGVYMRKEEFEKQYGTSVYNYYFKRS